MDQVRRQWRYDDARGQSGDTVIESFGERVARVLSKRGRSEKSGGFFFRRKPKAVLERGARVSVEDRKTGPRRPRLTGLNKGEDTMLVALRHRIMPPLDDCLHALQLSIQQPR